MTDKELTPELKKRLKERNGQALWRNIAGSDFQKKEPDAFLLLIGVLPLALYLR